MKTVDPGQILICRQKSTSTVLYGHVNPFARNLHLQCCSNLARDTHRSTFVRFSWPGLISTLPLGGGGGLKSTRGEISTRVKRNASCKRAIHFVHMAGWNLTRVETRAHIQAGELCLRSLFCGALCPGKRHEISYFARCVPGNVTKYRTSRTIYRSISQHFSKIFIEPFQESARMLSRSFRAVLFEVCFDDVGKESISLCWVMRMNPTNDIK